MTAPRAGNDLGWDELVVLCATSPWNDVRALDQQLALGLSAYAPVLYVEPPVPWRPGATRAADELVADRVLRFAPHVPQAVHPRGVARFVRRSMRRRVAELGGPRVRATIVPSLRRYFGGCDEEVKVFYASDEFVAGADRSRLSDPRLAREMRRQPAEAHIVVVTSPALADTFRAAGHEVAIVPNGCDAPLLARADEVAAAGDVWLPRPIAGCIGPLSNRVDVPYLSAIAERGHSLLLVGACPRGARTDELRRLLEQPNVAWVGPRAADELPSYLQLIDVGLVPYATSPFNRASFPLKALDYLAGGRPVVSTGIDSTRWLRDLHGVPDDDVPPLDDGDLSIVDSPTDFADRVEKLFVAGRDDDAAARRRRAGAWHSWSRRSQELAGLIGLSTDRPSPLEEVTP